MPELTDWQLALLSDLRALEEAGMINPGNTEIVSDGYDEGSLEVDVPGTLTAQGRKVADSLRKAARTIKI